MGVAQGAGQKRSQAGPPQDAIWCQVGRGGREGGRPLPHSWAGSPKGLARTQTCPKWTQGRATAATAESRDVS